MSEFLIFILTIGLRCLVEAEVSEALSKRLEESKNDNFKLKQKVFNVEWFGINGIRNLFI
jgi:hypothetical protein